MYSFSYLAIVLLTVDILLFLPYYSVIDILIFLPCYWLLTYTYSYLIIVLLKYSYSYLIIVLLTVDILLFLPCDSVIDIHLDILRDSIVPTHVLTIVFYNGAVLLRTGFTLYPQLMLIYSKSNILFSILKNPRKYWNNEKSASFTAVYCTQNQRIVIIWGK